jgi:hypothetical protein
MVKRDVYIAFKKTECILPIGSIVLQRQITAEYRRGVVYKQIVASVREVGLIEALVVYPRSPTEYLLLDGHVRLDVLKAAGRTEVRCTLSSDDEAYTYNRRVNHAPPVAQHFMILKALANGVSETRLAAALNVDVLNIQRKRDMLNGICPEAVALLRNRAISMDGFGVLRKMKPIRQIEAAEHMNATMTFSASFARALLSVTKPEYLVEATQRQKAQAKSDVGQDMFGEEAETLIRDLKSIEESYGTDVLTLTVCCGYVKRMIQNSRVEKYLWKNHPDLLAALRTVIAGPR